VGVQAWPIGGVSSCKIYYSVLLCMHVYFLDHMRAVHEMIHVIASYNL